MTYLSAIILGLIQGFTEFLPVSSSGHLVIVQSLIPGFNSPGILLEVILHAGTLLAVVYYYKDTLFKIDIDYVKYLLIGTLPAGLVGLFFNNQIELLFSSIKIVGFALLITSLFNYLIDHKTENNKNINIIDSFLIGIFQAFAIIPGVSRSGSTIFMGAILGLSKKKAAEFSFLLSVPAILGANLLEILSAQGSADIDLGILTLGFISAFVSGLVAIRLTLKVLMMNKFKYFAFYTAVLGILLIL